jgi:hypothetical protein
MAMNALQGISRGRHPPLETNVLWDFFLPPFSIRIDFDFQTKLDNEPGLGKFSEGGL